MKKAIAFRSVEEGRPTIKMAFRTLSKDGLIVSVLFSMLILAAAPGSIAEERTWYPVTAGSFTGLRPSNIDQVLITEHEYEKGVTYGLRSRPPKDIPKPDTCFVVLDLAEEKIVDEIHFQNQTNREATTNIGYVEIFVAENEADTDFDLFSRESYNKSVYRGKIEPVSNKQGLIRKVNIGTTKRRYFLIEVFADNKNVGNVGAPGYQVDTVQSSDILIQETPVIFADPALSSLIAHPLNARADGTESVEVTVHAVDENEANIPYQKVELVIDDLDVNIEAINQGITNEDGVATFLITSVKSGTATIKANVAPDSEGMPPVLLDDEVEITFNQVINPGLSKVKVVDQGPVSADGVSSYDIKVSLFDYDNQPVDGHEVFLVTDSDSILIDQNSKLTGAFGEAGVAIFSVSTTEASYDPVTANLSAKTEVIEGEGEIVLGNVAVNFLGRLKSEADGEPFSTMNVTKKLALGLQGTEFETNDFAPTDGISGWQIMIQLIDNNGPAAGRWVNVKEGGTFPKLGINDIQPQGPIETDPEGKAEFFISTENLIDEANIEIFALGDVGASWDHTLKFLSCDTIAPYVIDAYPEPGAKNAEVSGPIKVTFNKQVQLSDDPSNPTTITITPKPDSPGNPQTIVAVYDSESDAWELVDQTLIWHNPRLEMNVEYTARVEGVMDLENRTMDPYEWTFEGIDSEKPKIVFHSPSSWQVDVIENPIIHLTFSEALHVADGIPVGLAIDIYDEKGIPLASNAISFVSYDSEDYQVKYQLTGLAGNTTYSIIVSGAQDLAYNRMLPVTWKFTTVADAGFQVISFSADTNLFDEVKVNTIIEIYFNKRLDTINYTPNFKLSRVSDDTEVRGITSPLGAGAGVVGLRFHLLPGVSLEHDTAYFVSLSDVFSEVGEEIDWFTTIQTEVYSSAKQQIAGRAEPYVFEMQDSQGAIRNIEITVPEDAIGPNTYFQLRNVSKNYIEQITSKTYKEYLAATPAIYEFISYDGNSVVSNFFAAPVTITIPFEYTENSGMVRTFDGREVPATTLRIFVWNEERNEWLPIGGEVDLERQTVSCQINHFSIYGLLGNLYPPTTKLLGETVFTNNPVRLNGEGTNLKFYLSDPAFVTLKLFDRNGRQVKTLLDNIEFAAGHNSILIDYSTVGKNLPRGLYVIQLFVTNTNESTFFTEVMGVW